MVYGPAIFRQHLRQFAYRNRFPAALFLIHLLQLQYRDRLVEQGHLAAHLIFNHVVQQDVGVCSELHKVTAHLVETAVVMLFPELLERFKARVAAVVEGIDAIAGTFGHGQRLLQTDDLNRGHDFIKAGVVRLTRVERKCLNIVDGYGNFLGAANQRPVFRRCQFPAHWRRQHAVVGISGHQYLLCRGLRPCRFRQGSGRHNAGAAHG